MNPSKRTQPDKSTPVTTEFSELPLPEPILRAVREAGFTKMTPIQKKALPIALSGSDVAGQAQTGTGKTATFLLSMFTRIMDENLPESKAPSSLILAPTRELALQIFREAKMLANHTDFRIVAVYGGEGYAQQERFLRQGTDIIVGTPGRTLDFLRRRILDLSQVRYLVIDEADRLLDMGFWDELRGILRMLPNSKKRQSMLFSATLDHRALKIVSTYMNEPVKIRIRPESIAADGIDQTLYHVEREKKFALLLGILGKEPIPKGLIFTNMKLTAAWLVKKLYRHGYSVDLLTGDLRQRVRNKVLDEFQSGRTPLLVASDVASRGLHIDDVTHIINYDIPQDPEDYVHRIGRTARAGKKGKAYTLACDQYCWGLPEIEKLLGNPLPSTVPYEDDYGVDNEPEFTVERMLRQEREQKAKRKSGRPRRPGPFQKGKPGGPRKTGPPKPRSGR